MSDFYSLIFDKILIPYMGWTLTSEDFCSLFGEQRLYWCYNCLDNPGFMQYKRFCYEGFLRSYRKLGLEDGIVLDSGVRDLINFMEVKFRVSKDDIRECVKMNYDSMPLSLLRSLDKVPHELARTVELLGNYCDRLVEEFYDISNFRRFLKVERLDVVVQFLLNMAPSLGETMLDQTMVEESAPAIFKLMTFGRSESFKTSPLRMLTGVNGLVYASFLSGHGFCYNDYRVLGVSFGGRASGCSSSVFA